MYDVIPITTEHDTACGPASLKMLLAYYGTDVELSQLIEECGVSVNGCTGKDILRVGRAHGLDMTAFRMDAEETIKQDRPCICWWKFRHFVVYCGKDANGDPVICNPSRGRYSIDAETFASFYSDVAFFNGEPKDVELTAEENIREGEAFEAGGQTFRALRPIARGERLTPGGNVEIVNLIDLINEQNEESEEM